MGWTSPLTWTVGQIVTKALLDLHLRDNLKYLKGEAGVPTIESGLIIDNTGGDEYLQIPSLTTTERNLLTPVNGMVIYNETTTEFNKYEAGAWKDLGGGVDHGGLDGLADDDHTQYALRTILTTRGDILYRDASDWARLAKGTAGHYLKQGANDPEWAAGTYLSSSGNYTGDDSDNRAIAHGLAVVPKLVIITAYTALNAAWQHITITRDGYNYEIRASGAATAYAVTAMTTTNFYVDALCNVNTALHYWTAIG